MHVDVEWNVDSHSHTHTWTVTLEDGTTVTKSKTVRCDKPSISESEAMIHVEGEIVNKWAYNFADGTDAEIYHQNVSHDYNGAIGAMEPNTKKDATFTDDKPFFTFPAYSAMYAKNKLGLNNGYISTFKVRIEGSGEFDISCSTPLTHDDEVCDEPVHTYENPFPAEVTVAVYIPPTRIYPQNLNLALPSDGDVEKNDGIVGVPY